jgi:hypothetical protein
VSRPLRQDLVEQATQLETEAKNPGVPGLTDTQRAEFSEQTQARVRDTLERQRLEDQQRARLRQEEAAIREKAAASTLSPETRTRLQQEADRIRVAANQPGQPTFTDAQRNRLNSELDFVARDVATRPELTPEQQQRLRSGSEQIRQALQQPGGLTEEQWNTLRDAGRKIREDLDQGRLTTDQAIIFRDALDRLGIIVVDPEFGVRPPLAIPPGWPPIPPNRPLPPWLPTPPPGWVIPPYWPPPPEWPRPPGWENVNINVNINVNAHSNDNDDNENANDNGNDNANDDDDIAYDEPLPPPPSAPPPPPPDALAKCLNVGEQLEVLAPRGSIIVTAYSNDLDVRLSRIDRAVVPLPPHQLVEPAIFQMNAAACSSGVPHYVLPHEVNLALHYTDELVVGHDESRLAIYWYSFETSQWSRAPKLFTDPSGNHLSASVTGLGVYAIVQE